MLAGTARNTAPQFQNLNPIRTHYMQAQLVHEAQQLVGCVQMMILDTKKINDTANWEGAFCAEPGGSPMRVPNWGLTSMPATNAASRELVRLASCNGRHISAAAGDGVSHPLTIFSSMASRQCQPGSGTL